MAKRCRLNQSGQYSVLAAVQKDWQALELAAESCKEDREIVLAAVQKDWRALELAAKSCKGDRAIVLAA
eukprot:5994726-Amphidinium_carterae.1